MTVISGISFIDIICKFQFVMLIILYSSSSMLINQFIHHTFLLFQFAYLMPKLYKSLVEFQQIFKLLIKVEVEFADDPFCSYNKTRHELIGKTLQRLYSTIAEIRENMVAVNISVPQVSQSKNLHVLAMKVDAPQCLKNDYIAFRAYGNLLNNWYSEFRCPRGKKVITSNSRCALFEAKLKEKKDKRDKNTER